MIDDNAVADKTWRTVLAQRRIEVSVSIARSRQLDPRGGYVIYMSAYLDGPPPYLEAKQWARLEGEKRGHSRLNFDSASRTLIRRVRLCRQDEAELHDRGAKPTSSSIVQ